MADLITLRLTFDELTSMMHALEVAKDEAWQAVLRHYDEPRNQSYRQLRPELRQAALEAAETTYQNVTELRNMVTDIWRENHPSAAE